MSKVSLKTGHGLSAKNFCPNGVQPFEMPPCTHKAGVLRSIYIILFFFTKELATPHPNVFSKLFVYICG